MSNKQTEDQLKSVAITITVFWLFTLGIPLVYAFGVIQSGCKP